jgi:uncharacterized protein YdhG (YjbR/CyaY superfamily)
MSPAKKPATIDEYLAPLRADQRRALEALRRAIQAAAPQAVECITYQIPTFKLHGKSLVAFGAAKSHYALYPMSSATVRAHAHLLKSYSTSRGTIRFPLDAKLPAALVRKIVKARIAENVQRERTRAARRAGARTTRRVPRKKSAKKPRGSR